LQQPLALTNQGWIARRVCSHVTPKVFFGAIVLNENKQVGNGREHQVMMKPAPTSTFKVIQPQIIFGALEVLFDMPT